MSENFRRRRDLLGGPSTLQINPLTRDFKQPESVLKKTVKSGPSMAEIGTVVGLGAAAGYAGGKKGAKDVMEKESKKPTKKLATKSPSSLGNISLMKANPAGGKKKGMNQEERRKYFGVKKRNTGGMSKDRLTEKDIETAEMVIGRGGDRLTKADIKKAEKSISKFSKGGTVSDYIKDLL